MKKLFKIILLIFANSIYAQKLPSFQAPEPSKVYEFTKYDQIPVGEYTGVPNISIPLYAINLEGVSVPIDLRYHAGGLRVSEEASNVGLGWNMNFGMITQTINDEDDLDTRYTKKLLKYQKAAYPVIYEWPMNCSTLPQIMCQLLPTTTNCTPEPTFTVTLPSVINSIFIATNGYPIEGKSFCQMQDWDINNSLLDTEPDIFRVDFFGHSLKFIKRFDIQYNPIEVLNNKGYKIETIPDPANSNAINWKIITPDGNQYIFGKMRKDNTSTSTDGLTPEFLQGGGNSYTNNWSLIKIITTKNKAIDFEYTDYGITKTNSYSQKMRKISQINVWNMWDGDSGMRKGNLSNAIIENETGALYPVTYSGMYEKMIYVNKISTPNETITFEYSDRIDRLNDKKMDRIIIKNLKNALIKSFNFSYDYFIASETGNTFVVPNSSNPNYNPIYSSHRLKLLSLQEVGSNPYVFNYDEATLPRKISAAVDFWGFYNGKLTNTSLAPNPATIGYPAFGNNGNDKSAYVNYAKASLLKAIQYPTGGKIEYEYELNEYERASFETVLPNAGNIIGDFVKGNGVRIKSILLTDNGILQRKTNYTYSGGISLVPFEVLKHYTATIYNYTPGQNQFMGLFHGSSFSVDEFNDTNYKRPALLNSYNSVGYNKVTMSHESLSGNGKTIYSFANKRDEKSYHQHDYKIGIEMPSLMDINAIENGKILSTEIYNEANMPVVKTEYTYTTKKSNIFYGNTIVGFRNLFGFSGGLGVIQPYTLPQHLVGYYAIYGKQSLISTEKVTEYFPSGSRWNTTSYSYNANNLIISISTNDHLGRTIYSENTSFYSTPELITKNMLSLPLQKNVTEKGKSHYSTYTYQNSGNFVLPSTAEINFNGSFPYAKNKIFYDQYDTLGNLLQFHNENGINTSVIWGYNQTLPIAKIENASYTQVSAYVANLQNLSNTGTEDNLITSLQNLRIALPNAMVSAYTHIPGLGVSSITDPKGLTMYYKYDSSGRLESIKDAEKKMLLEYEYHFRPQN